MHGNGNENNSQTFTHAYTNTLCAGKKAEKTENIYKNHLLIDMCVCTSALAYMCLGVCESLIFFARSIVNYSIKAIKLKARPS